LGEIFSERAGILNIGIEGEMLVGALAGFLGTFYTHHVGLGFLIGMGASGVFSLIMGFITITLKGDQVITGIILNILALGLTSFVYRALFGTFRTPPSIKPLTPLKIPVLGDTPYLGTILFHQNLLVYLAFLWVPVSAWILFKTQFGLNLRAVGEHPRAADTLGVQVERMRYIAVILGGIFSGLGGCFLTLAQLNRFTDNITAGRGFIAIAAVIFGKWNPYGVAVATLLFGIADGLQLRLQALGTRLPYQFLLMLPYILTIVALIGIVGKSKPPAALAVPYQKDN
jgi:simple sugar transport system permease protein